jgi:hypothetical protein
MDFGAALGDSFGYAKDAVVGKWMEWIKLIIATLLLGIPLAGYTLKVYRGDKPAPEVAGWVSLIVDGIKLLIVSIIWTIPAVIIFLATIGSAILAAAAKCNGPYGCDQAAFAASLVTLIPGMLVGVLIMLVVAIITGLLAKIGIIRFARTGSMGEAFNFGAILETIGKIGWLNYIVALIVLFIVMLVVGCVVGIFFLVSIPLGYLVEIIIASPVVLFISRYYCLLYDSAKA